MTKLLWYAAIQYVIATMVTGITGAYAVFEGSTIIAFAIFLTWLLGWNYILVLLIVELQKARDAAAPPGETSTERQQVADLEPQLADQVPSS